MEKSPDNKVQILWRDDQDKISQSYIFIIWVVTDQIGLAVLLYSENLLQKYIFKFFFFA